MKTNSNTDIILDFEHLNLSLLDEANDRIWVIDINYCLVYGNLAFQEQVLLFSGKYLKINETVFTPAIPENINRQWLSFYNKVLVNGEKYSVEAESYGLGTTQFFHYNFSPVFNTSREIIGVLVIGHNITDRKIIEKSLKTTNELFDNIQNLTHIGGWEWDLINKKMLWTRETYFIHDLTPDEISSDASELIEISIQCYYQEDRTKIKDLFLKCCHDGIPYIYECQFITTKGRHIWIRTIGNPIYLNGKIEKVSGYIIDITEQKLKELALNYSESKFRAIIEQASEMLFLHDMQGNIIEVNRAAIKETGYSNAELLQLTVFDIDPDAQNRLDPENVWNSISLLDNKTFESMHHRKDGSNYPAEISISKILFGEKEYILAIARNISERKLAEKSRKENEELFQTLFEKSQAVKLLIDPMNGSILNSNQAATSFYGYSKDELNEMKIYDINTLPAKEVELKMKEVMDEKKLHFTFHHKLADKTIRIVEAFASPLEIGGRKLIQSIIYDITEKTKAEEALKISEQHANALISAIPDMIFRMNAQGVFLYYKAAKEDLFIAPEIFIGKNVKEIMPPWFAALSLEKIELTLNSNVIQVFDYQLEIPNKGIEYFECRMVPYSNNEILAIVRNITERKEFEREITEKQANARAIMESTSDVFILIDKNGKLLDCNEAHASRFNLKRSDLLGKNVFDYLPPDIGLNRRGEVQQVITTGKPYYGEDYRNGIWNEYAVYPIFIDDICTENVAVFAKNITEKKQFIDILEQKNKELQYSEEKFRKIFEDNPLGIAMVGQDYRFIQTNEKFSQILDYSKEELNRLTFKDFTHPDYIATDVAGLKCLATGNIDVYKVEKKYLKKDNSIIWANLKVSVIRNTSGDFICYMVIIEDITLQKETEEIIRNNEEKYRTLFEDISQGVFYQSADGTIIDINDSAAEMFGLSKKQILGKDSFDARWKVINESYELIPPEKHPSMIAIKTGLPVTNQTVGILIPETGSFNWLIIDVIPQFRLNEKIPYQVFASMQNITHRKNAEDALKISEGKYRELNATKDKFFSIIAHDLKSPFNAILGFSSLLTQEARTLDIDEIENYASIINATANQTIRLLENLLDWARMQQGKVKFHQGNVLAFEVVADVIKLLEENAHLKQISILNHLRENQIIAADEYMLNTIFRNLISNAIKFSQVGGIIEITSTIENQLNIFSVIDNGVGISPENFDKLFKVDTTFTTRGTNNEKGTGLGLILCKEFVEKHGGKIWAESVVGQGCRFYFSIPENDV